MSPTTTQPIGECHFCAQRANDVAALRREGERGKQLGAWEREILRRSGASRLRLSEHGRDRSGGLPLLREIFPERPLRAEWESPRSPSQPVLRAAGARLEGAGLVSLLVPTASEARRWIEAQIGTDWPPRDAVKRRLLLTNFSWRTLLGDQLVETYKAAFERPRSSSRIRWDGRLAEAHELADAVCARQHGEQELETWRQALANARRGAVVPRR